MTTVVDSITGLIAPVVAAGAVMKVTDAMFGGVSAPTAPRKKRKVTTKSKKSSKKTNKKSKKTNKKSCSGKKSCKSKKIGTKKRTVKNGIPGQTALPHGHSDSGGVFQSVFGHKQIKG